MQQLYLLSFRTGTHRAETLFTLPSAFYTEVTYAYLLAIVTDGGNHSLAAIQDKIENNGQHLLPVTAIVVTATQFCIWIK